VSRSPIWTTSSLRSIIIFASLRKLIPIRQLTPASFPAAILRVVGDPAGVMYGRRNLAMQGRLVV
jgi:hypothetical protein